MAEIIGPTQTEATAYFCPNCHTPIEVTHSLLNTVDHVKCGGCQWTGRLEQLAQSSFKHGFKSDDDIAQQMMIDLRNILAKTAAQTYGAFLLKWGFLDKPISALQLSTYIQAIAKSVMTTIIETRKTMTEEKASERAGVPRST